MVIAGKPSPRTSLLSLGPKSRCVSRTKRTAGIGNSATGTKSNLPLPTCSAAQQIRGMELHKAEVRFERPVVEHVEATLTQQFKRSLFGSLKSIALAVGSRGINNLAGIVRQTATSLKQFGLSPFIVPAMGSHGGATAEGQAQVLASYGITEQSAGCPIRSSMEVVQIPSEGLPHDLFMDRHAFEADGIILINRIKPHTDFRGVYESGLVKMSVIGLGKERQAVAIHDFGVHGLRNLLP